MDGQSRWLYQGSWVRSGSTRAALPSSRPSSQRPTLLLRWRQAQITLPE